MAYVAKTLRLRECHSVRKHKLVGKSVQNNAAVKRNVLISRQTDDRVRSVC